MGNRRRVRASVAGLLLARRRRIRVQHAPSPASPPVEIFLGLDDMPVDNILNICDDAGVRVVNKEDHVEASHWPLRKRR